MSLDQETLLNRLAAFRRIELVVAEFACTRNARLQYEQDLVYLADQLGLREPQPEVKKNNLSGQAKIANGLEVPQKTQ